MERVVRLAVVELLAEPFPYDEAVVFIDRHVATIEEPVEIAPERQPVADVVSSSVGERLDMCGVEHGKGVLGGHGARAVVGVEDADAEDGLPEPRPTSLGWAVAVHVFPNDRGRRGDALAALAPDASALAPGEVDARAGLGAGRPVGRCVDP